jgi:cytochrome c oxidase subunit II
MADMDPQGGAPGSAGLRFGPLTRLMLWLGITSAAFVVFVIVVPVNPWFPEATREAGEVDNLFKFMLAASGVIFIYVQGLLLAFVLRYRRQKHESQDAVGPAIHGHTGLEMAWSAVPALLLLVLAVLSLRVWSDEHAVQKNELRLDVRAYQFGFAFSLPQYGIKEVAPVTIPVNRPVYVSETSSDVIHSFWVPQFRIKQDAVPGLVTHEQFTPTQKGTFPVICTEFCGSGHSGMSGVILPTGASYKITVASEADFVAWLRKHGAKTLPVDNTTAALAPP